MAPNKKRIGLLIDYIHSDYSKIIINGIRKACRDLKFDLFIFPVGEIHTINSTYEYQNMAVSALITSKNLDGVIVCAGTQMHYLTVNEVYSLIQSFNPLPAVSISLEVPDVPSIVVECYNAYKVLIHNLVNEQHCKKFVIVGVRGNSVEAKFRTRYIKEFLGQEGIAQDDIVHLRASFHYNDAVDILKQYYEDNETFDFDSIICLNDEMAYGALLFCKEHNLSIPEDITLVGFDDLENSPCCFPSLTSINQQLYEQGYKSVSILNNYIKGKEVDMLTVIEAKVVLRESTCRTAYNQIPATDTFHYIDRRPKGEVFANYSGTEWYLQKEQLYQIASFYTEMQYNMSVEQLKSRLNEDIRIFDIKACAVVLYEKTIEMPIPFDSFEIPHTAAVFTAFDTETGYDSSTVSKQIKFDPNTMILPEKIIKSGPEGLFTIALFHNTLQYGYIVLKAGEFDNIVYELLTKIIAVIISNTYSYSLINKEATSFRAKYDRLDIIARTDELTGLNNRRGLYDLGQVTLNFAKSMKQSGMIVYSDMDGLKKINDTFGHESGDRAIIAESIIISCNFRSNDIVARIGGDEFAIICPGLTKEAFVRIQKQIDEDCQKWTEDNNSPFSLSISMGAVPYPSNKVGYQITPLLAEADILLYKEKRRKHKALKEKK